MPNSLFKFSSHFSSDFYKAIDDSMILSLTDLDGTIKYVSSDFCRISGYSKEELIGQNHRIVKHPDMRGKIFDHMRNTITSGNTRRGIIKNRKKDGNYYWVKTVVIPLKNENGEIIEYISIRNDVTKLINAILEINDYKKAIDFSGYFIKLDNNGFIKFMNKKFIKAIGYKESELLGKPLLEEILYESMSSIVRGNLDKLYHDVLGVVHSDEKNYEVKGVLSTHKPWKGIIKNKTNYGNFIRIDTTIFPIFDQDNKIKEYIIIATDVSDLEKSKQKLKISYHKLKELDDKKSEFLNIASHELRTPMTAIRGYISMMLDGDFGEINDTIKQYLGKILNNSRKLLDLINDMLDLAKLESSRLNLLVDNFDMLKLIGEISAELKPLILDKKHRLELTSLSPEIFVETDRDKMKHAIVNLLSNAIKFTPDVGIIKIDCRQDDSSVYIEISDNGIGISENNQKIIFERFGQVKNSLTRDINGTGLGLPIVQSTINRLGGELTLISSEGKGSKFTIKIPSKFI
ncbi:MAG: PAS domain S-box protein [Candidatus Gracilibacteria bacterium]|nr:PAS domain S-box protein [Candidatus Gracilibacteria bacterium]